MGTITERRRKDGSIGYFAQIMRRNNGKPYRESKTFDRPQAARAWLDKREKELDRPGALDEARAEDPTLSEAIDRYIADNKKNMARTKTQVLRTLKEFPIANMRCSTIKSSDIVDLARQLERTPQTTQSYLTHLGAIFSLARPAWGYPLDRQAMKDAYVVAKRLGITGDGQRRNRRPTADEIKALLANFERRHAARPDGLPMAEIIKFAIFSTRRREEITRIRWNDFEPGHKRVLVRNLKHPGDKIGNDVWCDLPEPAIRIAERQPRTADEIFPYRPESISSAFMVECKVAGIEDLHFHDLRHEGITRLFELGMNIPHVAAVSGHRSWVSLKRYTHIREAGDKWAWLD